MRSRVTWAAAVACAVASIIGACGGSNGTTAPSPTTPPTTPPGAVNTLTITIANNVATPKNIVVPLGSQVTFVNNDNRTHDMESNPHPEHTDCPVLAQVGFLS